GAALTGNAGFTVSGAAGAAITVSSAVVNATDKTVTLTLSRAVTSSEIVRVSYAKPAASNGVRDVAGNAAVDFIDRAVTNTTPAADTTPPGLNTATVNGNQLVLTYAEANTLDEAALTGNAGFTVSSTAGAAITVSSAVVNGAAKTVTLTLSRAVASNETVTVNYAKPANGHGVQDAAGNAAVDFNDRAVTNNTPADTTAPEISTTTVTGDQLVLTYTEANSLNGAALTGNAGFTVSSTDDAAITVSSAVVNGAAKTVTLTLSRAVVHREMLRVSYTKPTSGHGVRDAAGNDAANFSDRAVTNNTRDTTAPQLLAPTHDHDRPELTDDTHLSLRFSDTSLLDENHNNRPANRDFTVLVDGVANTVTDVAVNGMSLTLTLTTPVIGGQRVTVAYQDSTLDDTKGIRDTEGNSLASIPTTVVVNNLLDMVSPQLITVGDARPKVNGNQLVLSFSDTNNLDADPTHKPANEAFTVLVNGVANAVTEVTINAQTKTVTLTLTTAVTSGQSVTVAYADPSPDSNDANAIQDASGNDAPSFAATAVTNNTPAPTDTTPRVSNSELTVGIAIADSALTAGETTTVTFTFTEPVNGFDTRDITCTNGTLSQPAANAERTVWTATFTPTASINAPSNVFNVDLTGVTDNAGNAGESEITSANYSVDTRDTVAPLLHSATVNGTQLVLSFNDTGNLDADPTHTPANGAFTVLVDGVANAVTSVTVEPQAKTVTLTLTTAVTSGQSVTVAYADPTTGNDANAIQDAAGNDAASFAATAVTNNTPVPADTTAPALIITGDSRPKVTGNQLVLSFSDTGNLDADAGHTPAPGAFTVLVNGVANAVTSVTVEPQAKTVTLTLTTAVTHGQSVTVAYADPTAGNDANAIQDAAGNDAASFAATAVTNNTPAPADTTAPQLIITGDSRPKVTGDQLVLSFNDTSNLDGAALTGSAGFTVSDAAGAAITVSGAMVNATAKTVTLTLGRAAAPGETVHVSYAKPAASNGVQDAAGNAAVNFSNEAVTNNTPADTTPPVINTTTVNGDQLVLTYTETYSLDGATLTGNAGFTVASLTVDTGATTIPVNSAVVNGAAKTVTLTLSRAVVYGELVRVSYAKPATSNGVQDAAGNAAASFSDRDVVNDTPDTAAPQLITTGDERPTITDGIYLGLHFSDASPSLDDSNGPAKEDFTVLVNGAANTVAAVTTEGMYKIVLLTLSTPVQSGQRVTVSYQDSTPGNDNGIQDPTGNRLLSIPTTVVMNDTVAPQLITTDGARPKVNGNQLVLSFTDTSDLDADVAHKPANGAFTVLVNGVANAVTNVAIEPQAKTVTLTLSTAVTSGQTVTVAYADPTTDNDANAMQDAAGNDAPSFAATAVTNNTPAPADTTPPQLIITGDSRPKVTGNQLVLSFDDTSNLDADAGHTPAPGAFTVLVNSVANAVTNVTVDSQAKTVTLTLTTAVTSGQAVTVAYADPTTGNDANAIQDAAGNDAASFAATAVTNNTPDTMAPQLIITGDTTRPKVTGNQLVLSFDDTGNLDAD
ncbi:SwmB domain-containing protein, partial [Verminephrobacter aporrectodeae]